MIRLIGEDDITSSNSITFKFIGQDEALFKENLAFECSLDSATFEQLYISLLIFRVYSGEHHLQIRAIDEAGNTDSNSSRIHMDS